MSVDGAFVGDEEETKVSVGKQARVDVARYHVAGLSYATIRATTLAPHRGRFRPTRSIAHNLPEFVLYLLNIQICLS